MPREQFAAFVAETLTAAAQPTDEELAQAHAKALGIDQAGRTVISIYKNGDFVEKREVNRYAPNSGKWICLTCNAPRAVSAGSAWSRCTNCGDVAPGSMGHADNCRCRCCEDYRRAVAGDKEPSK